MHASVIKANTNNIETIIEQSLKEIVAPKYACVAFTMVAWTDNTTVLISKTNPKKSVGAKKGHTLD